MRALVVYAHPNPQSFNHAVMKAFSEGLTEAGHTYEVLDLYAIKFNSVLSFEDLKMLASGSIPEDIREQQEKVTQGRMGLPIIHPSWWSGPPAILKGWVDRVFSVGFAYMVDPNDGSHHGLLNVQKGLVINTAGDTEEEAERRGLAACMKKIEDEGILNFCGVASVQHVIFYNVLMTDDETRKGYLEEARGLGRNF